MASLNGRTLARARHSHIYPTWRCYTCITLSKFIMTRKANSSDRPAKSAEAMAGCLME